MTESQTSWFARHRDGFIIAKRAENLSPHTLKDYGQGFGQFARYWRNDRPPTSSELKGFLAWLREQPNRNHPERLLSEKTVKNAFVALKSFFRWYAEETGDPSLMGTIATPKVPERFVEPLTQDQVAALLKACDRTKVAGREQQRAFSMRRPTALRDRAIVLVLVDAGLRASELCDLKVEDVDLADGRVVVRKGKGARGRYVYLGKAARRATWRYLNRRTCSSDAPLFVTDEDRPLDRNLLRHLLVNLGERAGVGQVHPHRLRHTFATQFLRNGGNLLSLQRLLGHSSLEMVRRYAAIVDADLAKAHETGSLADRWRL